MTDHNEFRYEGLLTASTPPKPEFDPDPKYLANQIERCHPVEAWRDELAKLPEDKREPAAAYLRERYKLIMARRRKQAQGKRSVVGDREIEKLRQLAARL